MDVIDSLPTIKDPDSPLFGKLEPQFWRYYRPPFGQSFFFNPNDPYDDLVTIIWGPRGGGKSTTGVALSIVDGQMRGIPVISNIPISWVARDSHDKKYLVQSLPFNVEEFETGSPSLRKKRLLLDEGNYMADRLRSTSNNNMGIVDILQQARKFQMSLILCTINWNWIDPRVTGSLCDVVIECNDLYRKSYGKKHKIRKGERITWDIMDQSGKLSGRQFAHLDSRTFNSWLFWDTFDTGHFVNPREARQKRRGYDAPKFLPGPNGEPMAEQEWYMSLKARIEDLAKNGQGEWKSKDLYDALRIEGIGLRHKAGSYLRDVLHVPTRDTMGRVVFNLMGQGVSPS